MVALNAVSYYVHLPFFVENFDLLAPLCDKVAEGLISPKPPGHILILLETANALGLSKEELFEQPASAPGRAISDYCRRVFQDGSIIELWGAHVYEETLGHWSQQWSQALVGHYGLSQRQAIYFNAHAEADLVQHEDHMGHGPLNRMILQRILEQGKTAKKLGYDPKYSRLHHGRPSGAHGTARPGESLPRVIVYVVANPRLRAVAQLANYIIGRGAVMRALIFFAVNVFVAIASTANAAAQLPGKWATRAPMPSTRSEVGAAEIGGRIYVMGGYVKNGNLVEEYDPATDSWRGRAPLPKPLHHIGAAALNGKIYVIGGYISGVGPVDTVYEYDPVKDQWTTKKAMPTPRGALAVGVISGKIYAVGGVTTNGRNTPANESYDPVQDFWSRKHARMITPRDHHAIGVVEGKLYAIAGRVNGNHDRSVGDNEEYDPANNRWRTRPSIPTVRSGIVGAVLGGRIFVFGGEYGRQTHATVESYDPAKNKWQAWAPMPTARHGLGAAVIGNSIYVISGGPQPGATFSSVNEVLTP